MKALVLLVAVFGLASTSFAQGRGDGRGPGKEIPAQLAKRLAFVLQNVSLDARKVAMQARRNGADRRAVKFRKIAMTSRHLSAAVKYQVLRALQHRGRQGALMRLRGLRRQFQRLNAAVSDVRFLPQQLGNKLKRAKMVKQKLRTVLQRGGRGRGHGGGHLALAQ